MGSCCSTSTSTTISQPKPISRGADCARDAFTAKFEEHNLNWQSHDIDDKFKILRALRSEVGPHSHGTEVVEEESEEIVVKHGESVFFSEDSLKELLKPKQDYEWSRDYKWRYVILVNPGMNESGTLSTGVSSGVSAKTDLGPESKERKMGRWTLQMTCENRKVEIEHIMDGVALAKKRPPTYEDQETGEASFFARWPVK
jgi:hypothetical protein